MKDLPNAAYGKRTGSGAVASWYGGGIMGNQKTDLVIVQGNVNAQGYINVLRNHLLPFMQNNGPRQPSNMTMLDPILPG